MSLCVIDRKQCTCQPDEGVFCRGKDEITRLRSAVRTLREALEWYAGDDVPEAGEWRIVDRQGVPLVKFSTMGDRARAALQSAASILDKDSDGSKS